MIQILLASVFILSHASIAAGYCYSNFDCNDGDKTFVPGDQWTPASSPCETCHCSTAKRYVLQCDEVDDKVPEKNAKKSSLYARIVSDGPTLLETSFEPRHEEIEITQEEVAVKVCGPSRASTFNLDTMTLEEEKYKVVDYYYTERVAHCCSSKHSYSNVHPACIVKETGLCTSEVVMKDDESQPCTYSMSMVG